MGKTLKEMDLNLSFVTRVEPLNHYEAMPPPQRLREGDVNALDDQYTFIQRIPRSHYVWRLARFPTCFLHPNATAGYRCGARAFSLAFPVFYLDAPALAKCSGSESPRSIFGEGHLTEHALR